VSFTRVLPSGFPVNGTLTSAEINQLDLNASLALDKTGDTIPNTSTITWSSGSVMNIASGAAINVQVGGKIQNAALTWLMDSNAITVTGAGTLNVTNAAVMSITGAGSLLRTASGGRIQLADNDYPTFSATRSVARKIDFAQTNAWGITGAWTSTADGLYAPASSSSAAEVLVPLWPPHSGATIASIEVFFTPQKYASAGGLRTNGTTPLGNNIAANLMVRPITSGLMLPARTKFLVSDVAYGSSSPTYGDGNVKSALVTTSAVVDNTQYVYAIYLKDESGTNAVGNTTFHGALVTYNNIADMRFP